MILASHIYASGGMGPDVFFIAMFTAVGANETRERGKRERNGKGEEAGWGGEGRREAGRQGGRPQ